MLLVPAVLWSFTTHPLCEIFRPVTPFIVGVFWMSAHYSVCHVWCILKAAGNLRWDPVLRVKAPFSKKVDFWVSFSTCQTLALWEDDQPDLQYQGVSIFLTSKEWGAKINFKSGGFFWTKWQKCTSHVNLQSPSLSPSERECKGKGVQFNMLPDSLILIADVSASSRIYDIPFTIYFKYYPATDLCVLPSNCNGMS